MASEQSESVCKFKTMIVEHEVEVPRKDAVICGILVCHWNVSFRLLSDFSIRL
jgi:hypothetical protein